MRPARWIIGLWLLLAAIGRGQEPMESSGVVVVEEGGSSVLFARIESLMWSFEDQPLNTPLLTARDPNRRVLLGDSPIALGDGSGFRLTFGTRDEKFSTFEVVFTYLSASSSEQTFTDSTGQQRLAIPFLDVVANAPSGFELSRPARPATFVDANGNVVVIPEIIIPGLAATVSFTAKSDLFGFEANDFMEVFRDGGLRIHAIGGLRYLGLRESLELVASSIRSPALPNDVFTLTDMFETQNHFLGAQAGGRVMWDFGWLSLSLALKVAVGPVVQVTRIDGTLNTNLFAADLGTPPRENEGGVLAQSSNIGASYRVGLAIVPEFQAGIGISLARWLRLNLGFTGTYISNVARPGDQIDNRVNPTRSLAINQGVFPATGPNLPARLESTSAFRSTGINIGLEFSY